MANRKELDAEAMELGLDPSVFGTKAELEAAIEEKKAAGGFDESNEVKVKEEVKEASSDMVVMESADGRVLECRVNGKGYKGMKIEVSAEWIDGVKETLLAAGYLLK